MKLRNFLAIIVLILTAAAFLFATPAVDIDAFGKNIKWDGLNLATITNNKYEGELQFQKGLDLDGGEKYTFSISLEGIEEQNKRQFVEKLAQELYQRVQLYGYKQVDLNWKIEDSTTAKFELITTAKSEADNTVIQLLASKGVIEFWTEDPNYNPDEQDTQAFSFLQGMKMADITSKDVDSIKSLYSSKANGYGFEVQFKKIAKDKLYLLSQNETSRGTMMVIDGQPIAFRTYPIENLTSSSKKPVIFMSSLFSNSFDINDVIPVLFKTDILAVQINLQKQEEAGPMLGDDYISNLKFSIFISILVIMLVLFIKYRGFGLYHSGIMIIFLIWLFFLLKLMGGYLTLPLVFSIITGMAVNMALHLRLANKLRRAAGTNKSGPSLYKAIQKEKPAFKAMRKFIFLVMGISIILGYLPYTEISDLAAGIGAAEVVSLVLLYLSFYLFIPQFITLLYKYENRKVLK